jgi:C-terminal processing protease CtpA/Prc
VAEESIRNELALQKLNANTLYLRLPTFNHTAKPKIDSLLELMHDLITETPNLIIDVRNNGGGSDVTYSEVIKYLYTGPIKVVSSNIWSSEDNIQKFETLAGDKGYPESSRKYFQRTANELRGKPNSFYKRPDETIRLRRVLPYPKKIVILMNRNCASSCEQFILAAAYSDKVTLMGENTAGILDYGNVHSLSFPCSGWVLQYATSRTNRLPDFPVDNIGLEPRIKLADGDWIQAALKYLDAGK